MSIGIVAEDGREFYRQSTECELWTANDWVKENVLPHLEHPLWRKEVRKPWSPRGFIRLDLKEFLDIECYGKPEFWGYYADYDWVAFCQLWGTMMDLPKGWPKYCMDIKQWCKQLGDPALPEQGKGEHHALADARWNRTAWEFLREIERDNAFRNSAAACGETVSQVRVPTSARRG